MNIESLLALPLSTLTSLRLSRRDSCGTFVAAACLLEASSVKAGNVHPQASFDNMDYGHFRLSAEVTGKTIDGLFSKALDTRSKAPSVGDCIYEMTQATSQQVGVNTNLGTLILLGPLLVATHKLDSNFIDYKDLQQSVSSVLATLNRTDSEAIYKSIQIANPGGLGTSNQMDALKEPPASILDAMSFAQQKDDVAKQWVSDYEAVFSLAMRLRELVDGQKQESPDWLEAISLAQIEYLASNVDSLIVRKNNNELAVEVRRRAEELISLRSSTLLSSTLLSSASLKSDLLEYQQQWNEFDDFLRADGNRRNPGTTADLLAAACYVSLVCEASCGK